MRSFFHQMRAPNVSIPVERRSVIYKYANPIAGKSAITANHWRSGGFAWYAIYANKALMGIHPKRNNRRRFEMSFIHVETILI